MNRAVIGVGSNIAPKENIAKAKAFISHHLRYLAESNFIETAPIGFLDQPSFMNGAFLVETDLSLDRLDSWLRAIEDQLGRVRTENKYGPRTIDLDVLVWNGQVIDPHVYERPFLRDSIQEVWPELAI